MNLLIDSHAHLSMLAEDEEALSNQIDEWISAGLTAILDVGTRSDDLEPRIGLVQKCLCRRRDGENTTGDLMPTIRFSAGIWPSEEAIQNRQQHIDELEAQILKVPRNLLAAIGECGLDRHWNSSEQPALVRGEQELFEAQLDLARRYSLPVIVHSREAARETLEIIRAFPSVCGVIHCFSYGPEELLAFQDLGWYISFAGNLTYKNAQSLRDALGVVSMERLLLETDSPYLAPVPHRGKAANPAMVRYQYEGASQIKHLPVETIARQVFINFNTLFKIM
jgi:TatD DNase family protein